MQVLIMVTGVWPVQWKKAPSVAHCQFQRNPLRSLRRESRVHGPASETMETRHRILRFLLRVIGSAALLAIFAVVMPYTWMNAIHKALGMGTLPDDPIVGYLARSTSAFYAWLGVLFWLVSFDLRRYRPVVVCLGGVMLAMGLVLSVVDWVEGMPRFWSLQEGLENIAFGLAILWLARTDDGEESKLAVRT